MLTREFHPCLAHSREWIHIWRPPAFWPDVHHRLATYISDDLSGVIGPHYYAHVGERVYLEWQGESLVPDAVVVEATPRPAARLTSSAAVLDAPASVDAPLVVSSCLVERRIGGVREEK